MGIKAFDVFAAATVVFLVLIILWAAFGLKPKKNKRRKEWKNLNQNHRK